MHFQLKESKLWNDAPVIWDVLEDVCIDLYGYLRARIEQKGRKIDISISGTVPTSLPTTLNPQEWIGMLKDLSLYNYLSTDYIQNERAIRSWVANALSFKNEKHSTFGYFEKIKWIGPTTALAEWLLKLINQKAITYKESDLGLLLTWIDTFVNYPGKREALIVALSSSRKYGTVYFDIKNNPKSEFSFQILHRARASRKVK